ncbi:MAG: adenosylcobalamin-dependent ribonucleoside-diphosphate reductase [Clostridiales bacterium]|nr:adenosylcobalamin-dependent ribonucleoside-diphosphate reductase [Clostridiales bacterium]
MTEYGGLPTELGWKIFIDRYTMKDQTRAFVPGDLAVVQVGDDPRWPVKELAEVLKVEGEELELKLLTGENKGQVIRKEVRACDRPLERNIFEVARRVARGLASVEPDDERKALWEEAFYEELSGLRVVPGGRIWAGAGTGIPVTLYNCFVIPSPEDSRQGIVKTLGQMIEIMSRGGGVGITVSSLRPYRAVVRGVNGRSSGAASWMELYSLATGLVEQGGSRRGALMLQLDIRHPDWKRFVDAKKTPGKVENANISFRITDEFMEAVKEDREWTFWFPDTSHPDYDKIWRGDFDDWERRGLPKVIYETRPAREVWNEIVKAAWESAEPGVVFSTRHEKESNSWYFNPLISTNPCAEEPLPAWGVCTLGHVNLSRFYDKERDDVDWEGLKKAVRVGVRLLDNVIDHTAYFFEENRENQMKERRIGLGTLGLGELLIRLKLRYGSPEAVDFVDKLYRFIAVEAYRASIDLAKEKGPFPAFDAELFLQSGFMQRMPEEIREAIRQHGIRNVTVLTQAPTGTVGTMLDTSTGIEPFYSLKFVRRSRLGEAVQYVRVAEEWMEEHPGEELPPYFVGAMDLTPEEHIRMQAAIQRWTDSSISKTANVPADYTVEDTEKLYRLAYELGCKGVTIYRDKSRHEQVLHVAEPDDKAKEGEKEKGVKVNGQWGRIRPIPRPRRLQGVTDVRETPLGKLFLTLNLYKGHPFELFAQIGKAGSDVTAFTEAVARLVSLALRSGVDPREVADQLMGIGGSRSVGYGPGRVRSVPDAIGQFIAEMIQDGSPAAVEAEDALDTEDPSPGQLRLSLTTTGNGKSQPVSGDLCPSCGLQSLVHEEGCVHCYACGYSEC